MVLDLWREKSTPEWLRRRRRIFLNPSSPGKFPCPRGAAGERGGRPPRGEGSPVSVITPLAGLVDEPVQAFVRTQGCFAIRASSLAIFFGESTRSTQPAATALRGMEGYLADSSWARVIPPSALMASSPSVPSIAVPERTTPMA